MPNTRLHAEDSLAWLTHTVGMNSANCVTKLTEWNWCHSRLPSLLPSSSLWLTLDDCGLLDLTNRSRHVNNAQWLSAFLRSMACAKSWMKVGSVSKRSCAAAVLKAADKARASWFNLLLRFSSISSVICKLDHLRNATIAPKIRRTMGNNHHCLRHFFQRVVTVFRFGSHTAESWRLSAIDRVGNMEGTIRFPHPKYRVLKKGTNNLIRTDSVCSTTAVRILWNLWSLKEVFVVLDVTLD